MRIPKVLALVAVMGLCGSVLADPVAINNASFEEPAQDPGGWTNDLPGWNGPPAAGDAFIEFIPGFNAEGNQHLGIQNGEEVSQDLGISVAPNTVYTLTLGVGKRNASFSPPGQESTFGLYAGGDFADGGALLGEGMFDASGLDDLTFVDQSLVVTTGDAVPAGNLFLSLRTTGAGRAHYDNVRLDAVPVPEPATGLLAALAALGLISGVRRRR